MKWNREATLALAIALLLGFAYFVEPKFVTLRAQSLLAGHSWELAIVAVPMLLIIMTAGIDLSVGSMVALSAVATGLLFERGTNIFISSICGIAVGVIAGAVNGLFVSRTRVHPLLVTLATMSVFRGLAEGISLARPLSGYPESFLALSTGFIPLLVFAALVLGAHFVLGRMRFGRWIVAIGLEENVSRYSKIPVDSVKFWLYSLSGLACGLAAILLVARNNTAKADLGMGMELEAITAVVLGGASIHGGKGRVLGLVLGLILIHETREFVSWHWKQSELNLIVIGSLLILTVVFDQLLTVRRKFVLAQNGN
jgi:rhamnose transport system permease protein